MIGDANEAARSIAHLAAGLAETFPTDANAIFSPASIGIALGLLAGGATGETEAELAAALGWQAPFAERQSDMRALLEALRADRSIAITARAFGAASLPVATAFSSLARAVYDAPFDLLDFRDRDHALVFINRWIAEQTLGRIPQLLERSDVSPDTELVLVSAAAFAGRWALPFPVGATRPGVFHTAQGVAIEAPFMRLEATIGYEDLGSFEVIELAYASSTYVATLVLPRSKDRVPLARALVLPRPTTSMLVNLAPPRFTARTRIDLRTALEAVGVGRLFSVDAELTGIAPRLQVGGAVHEANVEVDEGGTVATAATAMISVRCAPRGVRVVADRPFAFVIRETATDLIAFAGQVANPAAG
jgi:serpin B